MAEVEQLDIIIDVIDSYSEEIDRLLFKLGEVEAAVQATDDITIDVDVRGDRQLDSLMARMATLQGMDAGSVGPRVGGRGGGLGAVGQVGGGAMAAADEASDTFELLDLRMSDLHNALARLVPLIFVFIGAIPAVIGGIVALGAAAVSAAAALAALGALGAVGAAVARGDGDMAAGFQEILSEVGDDLQDALLPLARRLEPLFEDALDGLDRLFQQIANRGDVLVNLSDQARDFGSFLMDWLPDALENMGLMVEAFSSLFGVIGQGMADFSVLEALTGFMAQAADELITFTALTLEFLPVIFDLSIGFLRVVNAIGYLVQGLGRILALIPLSTEAIGAMIASLLTAFTATLLLSKAFGVNAAAAIVNAIGVLGTYIAELISYTGVVSWATASTMGFAIALGLATGGITLLLGGVAALGNEFAGLSGQIDKATESLSSFESQRSSMSQRGANPYANPNVTRGGSMGQSRFASGGGDVNVTVEGDADRETVRNQTQNAMYRMERTRRSR